MPREKKLKLEPRLPAKKSAEQWVERGELGAEAPPASPSILTRKSGRVRQKLSIYLSPELAEQLKIEAVRRRCDASDLVEEALAGYLKPG
jgi:hypothetical protein